MRGEERREVGEGGITASPGSRWSAGTHPATTCSTSRTALKSA